MERWTFARWLAVGLTLCSSWSCGAGEPDHLGEARSHYEAWKASTPSSYELDYELNCYCDHHYGRVRVAGGEVVSQSDDTGRAIDGLTVDELYESMIQVLEHPRGDIELVIDAQHVPRQFRDSGDPKLADSGWGFVVTCFAREAGGCP